MDTDNPSLTEEQGYIIQRHDPETGQMEYAADIEWLATHPYVRSMRYVVTKWTTDATKPMFFTSKEPPMVCTRRGIQIRCIKTTRKVVLDS